MTTYIHGTTGVTFPDASVQGTALTTGTQTFTGQKTFATVPVCAVIPAFSAYLSAAQSVTSGVMTRVSANIEEFDTTASYDNVTNYRFTPTIAGYYQVNGHLGTNCTTGTTDSQASIYKNGVRFKDGPRILPASGPADMSNSVNAIVYLNGSTDYIELWGYVTGTGTITFKSVGGTVSYFQAHLISRSV